MKFLNCRRALSFLQPGVRATGAASHPPHIFCTPLCEDERSLWLSYLFWSSEVIFSASCQLLYPSDFNAHGSFFFWRCLLGVASKISSLLRQVSLNSYCLLPTNAFYRRENVYTLLRYARIRYFRSANSYPLLEKKKKRNFCDAYGSYSYLS